MLHSHAASANASPPEHAARERRRQWARTLIRRGEADGATIPRYGTDAWHRLSQDDPRRIAGVVIAAESWATDADDVPGRLRRELYDAAVAAEAIEEEGWRRAVAMVRDLGRPSPRDPLNPRGRSYAERRANEQAWIRGEVS